MPLPALKKKDKVAYERISILTFHGYVVILGNTTKLCNLSFHMEVKLYNFFNSRIRRCI